MLLDTNSKIASMVSGGNMHSDSREDEMESK